MAAAAAAAAGVLANLDVIDRLAGEGVLSTGSAAAAGVTRRLKSRSRKVVECLREHK